VSTKSGLCVPPGYAEFGSFLSCQLIADLGVERIRPLPRLSIVRMLLPTSPNRKGAFHDHTHPRLVDLDKLIEAYELHQHRTRGLRAPTLCHYRRLVRRFVRRALGDDPVDPGRFRTSDVIEFVHSMRTRFSPRSMKAVRTALRSFFRFLRAEGLCDGRLEAAIPAVAHWRLSVLPRHLSDDQLEQVLASLDASSTFGRRDRAIVLCLATLGLRPGEVARLGLEDIDWRRGTIALRSRKNGRGALLPLPRKVGRAIADYLRKERPPTEVRRVFVRHSGPHRGASISSNAVSSVAVRALRRAQVESPIAGAYVFRHSVASRMVRRGASLKEVADFLGHRSIDTATIYAKLDLPALREVALPWPEVTR
jgi:integrase/recombinase XerD